jgi:hypothetical protein
MNNGEGLAKAPHPKSRISFQLKGEDAGFFKAVIAKGSHGIIFNFMEE